MVWLFGCDANGMLAPQPGIEPATPVLEGKDLNTDHHFIFKVYQLNKSRSVDCTISQPSFTSDLAGTTQDLDILSNIK